MDIITDNFSLPVFLIFIGIAVVVGVVGTVFKSKGSKEKARAKEIYKRLSDEERKSIADTNTSIAERRRIVANKSETGDDVAALVPLVYVLCAPTTASGGTGSDGYPVSIHDSSSSHSHSDSGSYSSDSGGGDGGGGGGGD